MRIVRQFWGGGMVPIQVLFQRTLRGRRALMVPCNCNAWKLYLFNIVDEALSGFEAPVGCSLLA